MTKVKLSVRRGIVVLLTLGATTCVSGCAATVLPGYAGEPTLRGEPLVVESTASEESLRAWANEDVLVITTMGSGSCPLVPALESVDDERELVLISTSVPNREGACTADNGPRTFELDVGRDLNGYTVRVTAQ